MSEACHAALRLRVNTSKVSLSWTTVVACAVVSLAERRTDQFIPLACFGHSSACRASDSRIIAYKHMQVALIDSKISGRR